MSEESHVPVPISAEKRELTVTLLCDQFAAGNLELDDLERRLVTADEATTNAQLDELVRDLPALAATPAPRLAAKPPAKWGWALACMGGSSRKGEWTPPRQMNAIAVMGGIELDFREARLGPGTTHVVAVAVMGGIEITVPPRLPVEVRGLGIMGAVDQLDQASDPAHPDAPRLRVTAFACMGGVDVRARPAKREE